MYDTIIIGAGMSGLLAARALSDKFTEVIVVDRRPIGDAGFGGFCGERHIADRLNIGDVDNRVGVGVTPGTDRSMANGGSRRSLCRARLGSSLTSPEPRLRMAYLVGPAAPWASGQDPSLEQHERPDRGYFRGSSDTCLPAVWE